MTSFSQLIARLVTQRRRFVWAIVALIAVSSVFILVKRIQLDTEVLNLLPANFESVEGLQIYNRDFAQTRELTFALVCQPDDVDKLEEFAPRFRRLIAQTAMVQTRPGRFADGNSGRRSRSAGIAVPLLLNLEPQTFDETIAPC